MVPSKSRPEIVARIRAAGLTQQEIADTAGVSQRTISGDLNSNFANEGPVTITNSRGQQRPAAYARHADPDDDVTDQEIADTAGVSRTQVKRDLGMDDKKSSSGQNVDPDDDVIDRAEHPGVPVSLTPCPGLPRTIASYRV